MEWKTIGVVLVVFGLAMVSLAAILSRIHRRPAQKADRGGVIVNGDNSGVINTGKIKGDILQGGSQKTTNPESLLWKWLGRIGTIMTIVGFFVALKR